MFMSTERPQTPASRYQSRPGPHCRRAHLHEEAFGVNGGSRWTQRRTECLPMGIRLVSFQGHAYSVEKVLFYLMPDRQPGYP
jgi:hypothetical protein